jgi:hypothetical protein
MKKLFAFLLSFCLLVVLNAQTTLTQTGTSGAAKTTHTNADTSYHLGTLTGSTNSFDIITINLIGTKTSGTVGGTAVPFGSLDGTNWFQLYDKDSTSSQSLSDGANLLKWQFDKTRWAYYRIRVYTTGTQVSAYTAKLLGRKNPN